VKLAVALTAALALPAAAAAATPPGETVVYEEHAVQKPFTTQDNWPCLTDAGAATDEATLTGVETRHITVTAAGLDGSWFLAPYTIRATEIMRVTVDPADPALSTYSGFAATEFRERIDDLASRTLSSALFRARADDGSSLTFRFRWRLIVDPLGQLHVDRLALGCTLG
jgi:hypothetical protein